jgi:dTDP-4-amino-4,6-dideoxygalactose transaminase
VSAAAAGIPFFGRQRELAADGEATRRIAWEVLASGQALQGPHVIAFEAALAAVTGRAEAVAVASGTDALFLALRGLRIGAGDEVIVPALSFIASASCVLRSGARPVFVDVDDHYLIDLELAAAAITPRTRAIVAVSLFGQLPDPIALEQLACKHGLSVIDDAAQSLGAAAGERRAGSIGTVSCCSFDPTKPIAAPGSGGAVLCDDAELAGRVRSLRWHGRDASGRSVELGYNSQLPELSAALLVRSLERADAATARRREIAARYDEAVSGLEQIGAPRRLRQGGHGFSKYVLRVPAAARDRLRRALAQEGVPTRVHYAVALNREPCFAACAPADAPTAERLTDRVISLPIHAALTDEEVERVVGGLERAWASSACETCAGANDPTGE